MKIKHYNDAIDWLTRPKFNGGGSVKNKEVLPKRKPEEELKKRKKKRFEKLKEYLENPEEVEEMLELQEGGIVDPVSGRSISKKELEFIKKFGIENYKKLKPGQRQDIRLGRPGKRFMTEEKKAERAKKLRPVFKGKGSKKGDTPKVVDVSGPKELKEEYIDDFKKRLQYPKAGREFKAAVEKGEVLSNPQLAKKYGITITEVERLNSFFTKQKNLEYKKGTPASGQELRKRRLRLNQPGTLISGKGKIQFHHIMPIGGDVDITSKDVAFINKYVNASLQKYNTPLNRIADGISDNLARYAESKDSAFLKRIDDLNTQAAQIVDKTKKELPKKLQGLIGFNKITPVLDENATLINTTVERIGIDEAKTPGGKKGPKVKLSEMRSGVYTPGQFAKEATRVSKSLAPQLNAKLPIISTMYDVAKSIPGDVGKAKYLSAGFKTLGLAVAPYVAYTAYQDIKAGKNLVEALERNLIGTDIIGGTKDILAMTPEEREARAKVKQEQIAELNIDMPTGFGFIEAPPVQTDMALEEAKQKLDAAEQRVAQERAEDEAGVAAIRRQAFDKVIDAATGNRTTAMKLAGGGLLKQAGKRSGPPPEKGPGGLASLEDYARTMME